MEPLLGLFVSRTSGGWMAGSKLTTSSNGVLEESLAACPDRCRRLIKAQIVRLNTRIGCDGGF